MLASSGVVAVLASSLGVFIARVSPETSLVEVAANQSVLLFRLTPPARKIVESLKTVAGSPHSRVPARLFTDMSFHGAKSARVDYRPGIVLVQSLSGFFNIHGTHLTHNAFMGLAAHINNTKMKNETLLHQRISDLLKRK